MTKFIGSFLILLTASTIFFGRLLLFSRSGTESSCSSISSSSLSIAVFLSPTVLLGDDFPTSTASSQLSGRAELGELSFPAAGKSLLESGGESKDRLVLLLIHYEHD